MFGRGNERIPEWAMHERGEDLAWIGENTHVLWPAARQSFLELGRGAIVVDTRTVIQAERHSGNPMFYISAQQIEKNGWRPTIKMVREYDPSWELVAVLLKQNRESAYRIGIPSEKT